ncbi:cupin [Streptomyces antimicrobicus]|uniref:Cupin n=1 Tax=Streptomyces antimicrobicus TaxID=2883108 RepID=A0ABS8BB26_9ACTN|nr:cupin [Streptomyces antimicrobicus]MCB5181815.1 cupin [Streptomyces antimicrobicus]
MDDLNALAEEHLAAAREHPHGRSAHLVLHDQPLRQSLIALTVGTTLDEHLSPPAGSLLVLRGTVRLTAASGDVELGPGFLHALPPDPHALTALTDAVLLLTAVNP